MPIQRHSIFHIAAVLLLGLPLIATNWLVSWHNSPASLVYWVLAISAALLLLLVVGVLAICASILRARGRSNESISAHLRVLPVWLATILTIFGLTWLTHPELPVGSNQVPFDAARWKDIDSSQSNGDELTDRQKMLAGAITAAKFAGSRAAIESVLGPKFDTAHFSSFGHDLIYPLGPERGLFGIDSEWLLIWLDSDGKLKRFQIVTD